MPTDGPKTDPVKTSGGGSKKPTTTFIKAKDNMLTKETKSGGPADSGGKQGAYKQPY